MGDEAATNPVFDGTLYRRGEPGYEQARRAAIWNGRKPDRFPDLILVATSEQDVVSGVRFARDNGHKVGIRSAGHSFTASGVRDGGLLIDLSRFTDIEVDAATKTAWMGPAVRANQLGARLDPEQLSFPYGGCPTVGMGGFMLTGGYGLNGKALGSAAGNIKAIDVVTADGELIRADENTNSDYLWAARGGGYGFFGVVVRFQLQLHDAPPYLTQSTYTFSVDDFDELATWFIRSLGDFDPALMTLVFGHRSPPDFEQNVVSIFAIGFADSAEETREMLRPLEESSIVARALVQEVAKPATLKDIWDGVELLYPEGHRYFSDTIWVEDPTQPEFVAAVKPAFASLPTKGSHVMMNPWIPEVRDDAALSGTSTLPFHVYGVGQDPSEDERLQEWINSQMQRIAPFSNGVGKVNDSDLLVRDQRVLSPENEARLEQLRARYDPDGVFHAFLRPEASVSAL